MCGGTRNQPGRGGSRQGLSPRVRGNRSTGNRFPAASGSIPACAGEPLQPPPTVPLQSVYPRVCGGTDGIHGPALAQLRHGSIPACAGEPGKPNRPMRLVRVYPRVCGGTCQRPLHLPQKMGLSPRVRGNRQAVICPGWLTRSIPACAGEPGTGLTTGRRLKVYPRVCGGTVQSHH